MTLFGSLFSKRDKKSSNRSASNPDTSRASAVSEQDYESQWESVSQTTHSHNHGSDDATPVSSLLKLPFRRKASDSRLAPLDQTSVKRTSKLYPLHGSSSDADAEDVLRPPLKFSAFSEPDAFSTRSLASSARTAPDASTYQDLLSGTSGERKIAPKKSSGLLAWARERTKSRPSSPPPAPVESFNLKAFRHIRPESSSQSLQPSERPPSSSSTERPRRPGRPRGNSAASESSNRISIAAFREAQARRSATNSPVPSFRPSMDTLTNRSLTPTRSVPRINQTRSTAVNRQSTTRTRSVRVSSSSSSSASSSSEEDSDEDVTLNAQGTRNRTVKKRVPARAQSDLGHGQDSNARKSTELRRPILPNSSHSAPAQQTSPRSSVVTSDQPQAAVSNNAPGNDQANKRSPIASSNIGTGGPSKKRHSSDSDSSSNYSSEVDSDDAPLATLVGPRRPGSAASSASHLRSRIPAKPLIDINTLITDRSGFASPEPVINTNKGKKKADVEDSAGLAKLAALAREDGDRRATSPTPTINSLKVVAPQPQAAVSKPLLRNLSRHNRHHRRSSSDIVLSPPDVSAPTSRTTAESSVSPVRGTISPDTTSPVRAPTPPTRNTMVSPITSDPDDDDIMPALRYMMPDAYDAEPLPPPPIVESPPSPGRVPDQERIVPTPIRERRPPSAFSVTSRPQHRPKQSSTSTITPATIAASVLPLPTSSPPPLKSPKTTFPSSTSPPPLAPAAAPKSSPPRITRPRSSSMLSMPKEPIAPSPNSSSPSLNVSPSSNGSPFSTRASPMSTSKSSPSLKSQSQSPSPSSKSTLPSALSRRSGSRSGISPPPISSVDSLPQAMPPPPKPKSFITSAMRGNSPASSTGDSSSGRVPLTPSGSDFGDKVDGERGRPPGGLRQAGERKVNSNRRSVSFEDEVLFDRGKDNGPAKDSRQTAMDEENRRRERRRGEAKAAIELGNVINGRGPIDLDDEDDHNMPGHNMGTGMNQFNPMIGMGGPMGFPSGPGPPPGWHPWQQPGQSFMPPAQFSQDPSFLLAHQQAMMIAKQTYQMAVAQHALAVAGDEWERSSNVSGLGGGSQLGGFGGGGPVGLGGNMNMGMGMGMGMFGMGGGMGGYPGMGMGMPGGWPNGSLMVPPAARSAYGDFGSAQSDYSDTHGGDGEGWSSRSEYNVGGGNGGGGWSSRRVRTESFGSSSRDRSSRGFTGGGLLAQHQNQQQKQQKQQETYFPPYKGEREFRNGGNEANGYPTRTDGGSNSLGRNSRPGPRPRTLTAPSSTQLPAQHSSRFRDEPSMPPPSSWNRFQPGA